VLRSIVECLDFAVLSPVDAEGLEYDGIVTAGPAPQWQVIAGGDQYSAYFWGTPSPQSAAVYLARGTYHYAWYDARDGTVRLAGTAVSSGTVAIPAPDPALWSADAGLTLVLLGTRAGNGTAGADRCLQPPESGPR
jgi:hypothetical protein